MKHIEAGTLAISILAVVISGLAYYGQFIERRSDLQLQLISHIPGPDNKGRIEFEGCGMIFLVSNFGNTTAAIMDMSLATGTIREITDNGFSSGGSHYPSTMENMPIVVSPRDMHRIDAYFQSCNFLDIAKQVSSSSTEMEISVQLRAIGADRKTVDVSALILIGSRLSKSSTLFRVRSANGFHLNKTHIDRNLRDFAEINMTVDHGSENPSYLINRTVNSVPLFEDQAARSARHLVD